MNNNTISFILLAVLINGCATHPDEIKASSVSSAEYQNFDCDQIATEMRFLSRRANELYGDLDKIASDDAGQMGIGLVLFWPALFFLEGGDGPEAAEYARLKGQRYALEDVAVQKKCDPDSIPKFEEPKKQAPPAPKQNNVITG